MKPNFALDLTHEGIGLMYRGNGGWLLVGEAPHDAPNLASSLAMMRQHAVDLESDGFTVKLIIPPSQILFTTVTAPGPDDATREARIREGLEGLTPYAVDELVFDWHAEDEMAHVAVVARDTLAEAEAFANENQLNPICFAARARGSFEREAQFGLTSCAGEYIPSGATIEPDLESLPELMGSGSTSASADTPTPEHVSPQETTAPKDAAHAPDSDPSTAVQSPSGNEISDLPPEPPVLAPFPPDFEPDSQISEVERDVRPEERKASNTASASDISGTHASETSDRAAAKQPVKVKEKAKQKRGTAKNSAVPQASETLAFSSQRSETDADTPSVATPPPNEGLPSRIAMALPEKNAPSAAEREVPVEVHVPVTAPNLDTPEDETAPEPKRQVTRKTLRKAAQKGLTGASAAAKATKALAKSTSEKAQKARKSVRKKPAKTIKRNEAEIMVTKVAPPPSGSISAKAGTEMSRKSAAQKRALKEAEALTIFGARRSDITGEQPRYLGLALVLGLLLFIAVLAVWSMFFFSKETTNLFPEREDQFDGAISTGVDTPSDLEADPTIAAAPYPHLTRDDIIASDEDQQLDSALVEADEGRHNETLSPEAAETRYAATGIWERAPDPLEDPTGGTIDGLYVASIDPVTSGHDAVALPSQRIGELRRDAIDDFARRPPPPSGTRFDLDERGLVRATPEGALTQDGFYVFAGQPPLVPPARPEGVIPDAPVVTELVNADPDLQDIRPRQRPDGLVEQSERRILGGRSLQELAAIRPMPRPQSPQALAQAEAIANAVANASNDEEAAAAAAAVVAPTQQAVNRSLQPKSRPTGFEKIIADAKAASDASDGSVVVAAAPQNQTVTPSIPTRASVAKQATIKNAISLRKVALIGIYGSSAKRSALVRLSSGRYVKVGIGDRLDGGRVVSISESQLVYKKGSRTTTLKILPFS
ncbi:hypothetical protein O2N63_10705 [Aliiroseovarius sp. KMU-50]|uniref:Type IV pilus biogenesis n=1 Tax=Aliiroseovarius salicola TaxID=3009082 RepID=A0ABT4W215_9RHOB|nr:hypothetical protein [Aliiroseovarius sp. KMU-50]MDA5094554.1 hypothetical protein [Aliiroseovarius sp. KMU-50]